MKRKEQTKKQKECGANLIFVLIRYKESTMYKLEQKANFYIQTSVHQMEFHARIIIINLSNQIVSTFNTLLVDINLFSFIINPQFASKINNYV